MSKVYYENGPTKITSAQLVHGTKTIPLSLISQTTKFKSSFQLSTFATNIGGILLGLWLISLFSMWSILGLAVLALCGWNAYTLVKNKEFHLSIDLHNGDNFRLTAGSGDAIDEICAALQSARTDS